MDAVPGFLGCVYYMKCVNWEFLVHEVWNDFLNWKLPATSPSRSVIPENITRGQNEEGSPLEMDAQTQQHMENETLDSTQELSANC